MKPTENGAGYEAAPSCGGKTRAGGSCKNAAGFKTSHPGIGRCAFHGGATPTHERAAKRELARRECAKLGIPIEMDPAKALLQELWECAGNVAVYRALVQRLPLHPEPDQYGGGHRQRGEPGIYGWTYHASGTRTGKARPHPLVELYNDERDRLAAVAAAALKAGVEARRVQLAEAEAAMVFDALTKTLAALGMGDRVEEFRSAFAEALEATPTAGATPDAAACGRVENVDSAKLAAAP